MKTFIPLILLLIASQLSPAQPPELTPAQKAIAAFSQSPVMRYGTVAFMAMNLESSEILVEHNSFQSMVPASTQKLITTGAALELLGADFQFKTTLSHNGTLGEDGTLSGDLIVTGAGDPSFGSSYFDMAPYNQVLQNWTQALAGKGIKKISGGLVLDLSVLAPYQVPRKWLWEDMGNYFGAAPSGICWNDNTLEVFFKSGENGSTTTVVETNPVSPGIVIDNHVKAQGTRDDAWFFGSPGNNLLYAKGSIPPNQAHFKVRAAQPNPAETFGRAFIEAIKAKGISFSGEIRTSHTPVPAPVKIASHSSPPLSEIIAATNKYSLNLYAEHLLLSLDSSERTKTMEHGLEALNAFLASDGAFTGGVNLVDGSGLSPVNRVTAQALTGFLTSRYRSENFETYFQSLPVAGEEGTLYDFLNGTPAAGNMRAKSGSMHGVRSYAGFIKNSRGETIVFSIIANDFTCSQSEVKKRIGDVLLSLY